MSLVPAAIMILVNFFVVNMLMIFMSTILMYYFGFGIYKDKSLSLMKILYWILVPSQAYSLHQSILSYRELHTKYLRKNNIL